MEENNKKQSLENFTKCISKRFSIDENALLFCLYNDQKNYWNTLFNLISKKFELKKITESRENDNNENKKQTFNKDDIIKEIDNYLIENPDEVDEIWEKFKDNKIGIGNNDNNNNNNYTENNERPSLNIKKIGSNENNKPMNRPISPQKGKKSIIKIGNQKLNFSIGVSDNRRHQSIFGQIKKVNSIRPTQEIKNSFTKIYKKNSIVKPKRNYFFPQKNKNKNRHSVFLQINSSNFDYVSKKAFMPKNNRKSVSGNQNTNDKMRFSFNKSLDKSIESPRKKQDKKCNINTDRTKVSNTQTVEETNEDKLEKSDDKIEEQNEDKSDIESVLSNKEKNKEEQGYKENETFFNFEDSNDSEKKENIHNNTTEKIKEENINEKDIKPQINKEENEINAFPIYKNKNCVFVIKKQKLKPKSVAKPKPNLKYKKKIKKYLNLSECHQIYLCLNISNNKTNIKNKSKHFSNSAPKISGHKDKSMDLFNTNDEYSNSHLKNNVSKNNENISDDKSNDMSSKKDVVRKLYFNDEILNYNSSGNKFNSSNKKNVNNNLNTNIKPINNFRTLRLNNNHSSYKYKVNNYRSENNIKFLKISKYNSNNKKRNINKSQKSFIPKKIIIIRNKNKNYKIDNDQGSSSHRYENYMNKSSKNFNYQNTHKYINTDNIENKSIKNNKIKKNKFNDSINGNSYKPRKKYYLKKYKEAIENIMKNDDSIFNDERKEVNTTYVPKSIKKRIIKNDNTNSNKKYNITMTNNIIKKISKVKPQIKYYNTRINKYNYKNLNKRNIHSSTDNIYRK